MSEKDPQSTIASQSEADALQSVNDAAAENVEAALKLVQAYLGEHPDSAEMHVAAARLLSHEGSSEDAAGHYKVALSLSEEVRDHELEEWFENAAGIRLELTSSHGESIRVGARSPDVDQGESEVVPIEVQDIASLKDRRKDKKIDIAPAAAVPPPPDLTATADEEVGEIEVVDHYAIDDLHPAEAVGVAPPPSIHVAADNHDELERAALERTGTLAGDVFTTDDIKALQSANAGGAKEKLSALTVAVLVHAVVLFVLGLIVIAVPRANPPEIVAVAAASEEVVPEIEKKEVQKVTKPNSSSASRVNVLAVANSSNVAVPVVIDAVPNLEPIGAGSDFGLAMNFSADGAGNVSFFGSKTKANKVVFVVDASASMNSKGKTGLTKFKLMQEELKKTVKGLSSGVEFQIIFFSGPAWFVGDKVPDSRDKNDDWHQLNGKNFWHYKDGDLDQLPVGKYRQATAGTIRKTMREIDDTPATYGTDWRAPLKMAMVMEPDVIYFMTDGAVGRHPSKPPVVDDVIKVNRRKSKAKINTICLMVPNAVDKLRQLADDSRGEFTLVLEDGTALRGKELRDYERKNK